MTKHLDTLPPELRDPRPGRESSIRMGIGARSAVLDARYRTGD